MIRIAKDKIVIEIEHPLPDEFLKDIKAPIIMVVQRNEPNEYTELKQFKETNYILLELFKQL